MPPKTFFEGMDISWNRLPGGSEPAKILKQALDSFVPAHPEGILQSLVQARPLVESIASKTKDPLAFQKLKEIDETMALASGLWLEAQADKYAVNPGATLKVNFTALVRNPAQLTLTGVKLSGMEGAPALANAPAVLVRNQPAQYTLSVKIPENQPYSHLYWLEKPKDGTIYTIPDPQMIGNADSAPSTRSPFSVEGRGC